MKYRILIANNGLSALKFILSLKTIKNSENLELRDLHFTIIGMVTKEEIEGNFLYVKYLDEYILVESGPSATNYGNVELIVRLAVQKNIDMVWPGWGHASENYRLPESLKNRGIGFIGPSADAMKMLGDKIESLKICESLKVPVIPWKIIKLENENLSGKKSEDKIIDFIYEHNYPIMVKSSSSGGGKGITTIKNKEELNTINLDETNEEFFVCKLVENARHIEIQVVADNHKNIITLGGRDCTLQRRYQKLIEESPPEILCKNEVFRKMKKYAKRLIKKAEYIGVATVEFLFLPKTNEFYFLEVNSRIQVEHPCTEIRYGIEIPLLQVLIALNYKILKGINNNFYLCNTNKKEDKVYVIKKKKNKKHVIGIRIIAEDDNFNPTTGVVRVEYLPSKNSWGYFSVLNGKLNSSSDSQYGHIFVTGKNRNEALLNCCEALENLKISKMGTHLNYIKFMISNEDFVKNNFFTDTAEKEKFKFGGHNFNIILYFCLIYFIENKKNIIEVEFTYDRLEYSSKVYFMDKNTVLIEFTSESKKYSKLLKFNRVADKILVQDNIIEYIVTGDNYILEINNVPYNFYLFSDKIYSPSAGKIVKFLVKDNEYVKVGQKYAEIEIMKVRMHLEAPKNGIISISKTINTIIKKGEEIAKIVNLENNKNRGEISALGMWKDTKDIFYSKNLLTNIVFPNDYWYIPIEIEELINLITIFSLNNKGKDYFLKIISKIIQILEESLESIVTGNIKLSTFNQLLISIDKVIISFINNDIIKLRNITTDIIFRKLVIKYSNTNRLTNTHCFIPEIFLYTLKNTKNINIALENSMYNYNINLKTITYVDNYPYILYNNKIINEREENIIICSLKEYYNNENKSNINYKCVINNNNCTDLITTNKSNINTDNNVNNIIFNDKIFTIQYKSPFRSLIVLKENSSTKRFIFLNINEYSKNKIIDMKNLSYAVNDIIATTKINIYKERDTTNILLLNIDNELDFNEYDIQPIVEDSIFYFKNIFIESKYREAIINYKCKNKDIINNYKYYIRYNIFLEEKLYKNNKLIKRKIEGNTMDNIEEIKSSNDFIYLIKIIKNLEPINLYLSKIKDNDINDDKVDYNTVNTQGIDNYYKYNNHKYVLSTNVDNKINTAVNGYKYNYKDHIIIFITMDKELHNGSFSKEELILYYLLSRECRINNYIKIFICDNSGVRIGFSEEMLDEFEVKDDGLYLGDKNIDEDIKDDKDNIIINDNYLSFNNKIISLYSNKDSGSENLSLSALCAVETIKNYNKIFTLSYVSGMSVGIGAYLCRLGNRIIMKKDSVMLLTGYLALNKLLQNNYYKSNKELGGYEVLGRNGIVQKEALNDINGINEIFKWIDFYIDANNKESNNIKDNKSIKNKSNTVNNLNNINNDSIIKKIVNSSYENFNELEIIEFISDKETFTEYMESYAPNVITGRSKINNKTIGIISSTHKNTTHTPYVLHADSSKKIAEYLEQINKEKLPLLIIANYKGFSGGDKDMMDGVLKYGANIIEELNKYNNKIYIYIPPNGQLRGGTYVIFDKHINNKIRIAVHNTSEIGILEPEGLCEIKVKERIKDKINNKISNSKCTTYSCKTLAREICKLQDHSYRLYRNNIIDEYVDVKELREKIIEYFYYT